MAKMTEGRGREGGREERSMPVYITIVYHTAQQWLQCIHKCE